MAFGFDVGRLASCFVCVLDSNKLFGEEVILHFLQRYGWHGAEDDTLQKNMHTAEVNYPWLAHFQDRSVTELEFLHGHLNNPGQIPAFFCFRDKVVNNTFICFTPEFVFQLRSN